MFLQKQKRQPRDSCRLVASYADVSRDANATKRNTLHLRFLNDTIITTKTGGAGDEGK